MRRTYANSILLVRFFGQKIDKNLHKANCNNEINSQKIAYLVNAKFGKCDFSPGPNVALGKNSLYWTIEIVTRPISAWCTIEQWCMELWANRVYIELGNLGVLQNGRASGMHQAGKSQSLYFRVVVLSGADCNALSCRLSGVLC